MITMPSPLFPWQQAVRFEKIGIFTGDKKVLAAEKDQVTIERQGRFCTMYDILNGRETNDL